MIKAVLLDLDNTLLLNPDESFTQAYVGLMEQYFQTHAAFAGMGRVALRAVGDLNGERDIRLTVRDALVTAISQVSGLSETRVEDVFNGLYATDYARLRRFVTTTPTALKLFEVAREAGYAVVIATNPIYAAQAIWQRVEWSGLPVDPSGYALVTTSEVMHFAKPDPAYYIEIAARVGVEPDECIMVGDNPLNDIQPAQQVGMHTFHISADGDGETGGTLEQLLALVERYDGLANLPALPLQPSMIRAEMRGNLGALYGTLGKLQARYWTQQPDPREWSPLQIVCHLAEVERPVHHGRLQRILNEDNPFIPNPPLPRGADAEPCDSDGWRVTERFMQARLDLLAWLDGLQAGDWQRPARHSTFGLTTLLEMAHFTAQHDRLHINQLCYTLGQCV